MTVYLPMQQKTGYLLTFICARHYIIIYGTYFEKNVSLVLCEINNFKHFLGNMSIKFIHRAYIIIYFTIGRGGLYDSYLQFSRSVI